MSLTVEGSSSWVSKEMMTGMSKVPSDLFNDEMKSLTLEDGKCICKKSLKIHHKPSMNASQPSYVLENQFCRLICGGETNSPNTSSVKFWQGKGPHAPEQIHASEGSFQGPLKNSSDDSWFYLPTPCSVLGAAIPPAKPETKGRLVIVDP